MGGAGGNSQLNYNRQSRRCSAIYCWAGQSSLSLGPMIARPAKVRRKPGTFGLAPMARGDDLIVVGDPHHSLVEGPVAELAEGHAVADVVVSAPAPGNDVGGVHNGMLFRRDDPHPAQGAAVVVGLDHDPAPDRGLPFDSCPPRQSPLAAAGKCEEAFGELQWLRYRR